MGHVMRSLTLARALQTRDAEVHFVCREHRGNLVNAIRDSGVPVLVLPPPVETPAKNSGGYGKWLGVSEEQDSRDTLQIMGSPQPTWVVVDSYALSAEWETALRRHGAKIMVIDDLADRTHECDVLLDQNFSENSANRYNGLLPSDCTALLGPRYALLRPEYAKLRRERLYNHETVSRVFVFFGGTDAENMTALAIEALSNPQLRSIDLDVVVGPNNPHRQIIEDLAARRGRTTVHGPRAQLADLMNSADMAVGAGGTNTWERMCLGIPAVVIATAENQRPASEALGAAGLVQYAGFASSITLQSLSATLERLSKDLPTLARLSIQNQLKVDGLGAERVTEVLSPTLTGDTKLRPAQEDDAILYFNWANDPSVRANAVHTEQIQWEPHRKWFAERLRAERSRLFVMEANGLPVGQIRFDIDEAARISYSLDSVVRGRGWGKRLVALGVDAFRRQSDMRIVADVKVGNVASTSVFVRAGFFEVPSALGSGYRTFQLKEGEVTKS